MKIYVSDREVCENISDPRITLWERLLWNLLNIPLAASDPRIAVRIYLLFYFILGTSLK